MKKYDFINELKKIKKNFINYAKENSAKINLHTFEICMNNCYLLLRIECEDEDENTIVFR